MPKAIRSFTIKDPDFKKRIKVNLSRITNYTRGPAPRGYYWAKETDPAPDENPVFVFVDEACAAAMLQYANPVFAMRHNWK